jgi:hypothetical protein
MSVYGCVFGGKLLAYMVLGKEKMRVLESKQKTLTAFCVNFLLLMHDE